MDFFDCNAYFGLPSRRPLMPVERAEDLLAEMDHDGVAKALVWHIAQHDAAPQPGNELLARAIAPHERLVGCWAILPNQAREFPQPEAFIGQMKAARVGAVRAFPKPHKFMLNAVAVGDWFAAFEHYRVPVLLSVRYGVEWRDIYDLMASFPNLTCVVCDHGCWGEDRLFRPLIEKYPNLCVDTAQYLLDGGIEALVDDYGPARLLYGSGFPDSYLGGMMMAIRHAQISAEAKAAVACGNLERLLAQTITPEVQA